MARLLRGQSVDDTMLRWEAVENGEPRYLTDGQAALLLLDWGTPQEEVDRILRARSPGR